MAISPERETAPYVGFNPTMPVCAGGWRTEPPLSLPRAAMKILATTATAEPPEEPPGTRDISCEFFVVPKAECSVEEPIANSSMLVRPRNKALASFNFLITVASYVAL